MLIIVDKRMPDEAKQNLKKYGELIEFASSGITYEAISGHPDIFFCKTPSGIIAAPNTPREYLEIFTDNRITFKLGNLPVGKSYPETAHYNAVVTNSYLIHNLLFTDPVIKALCCQEDPLTFNPACRNEILPLKVVDCLHSGRLEPLSLSQGYSRCNLLEIREDQFITSDKGIEKTLLSRGIKVKFISPEGILLPGFEHGFLGGCCGINEGRVFVTGSLRYLKEGVELRAIFNRAGLEIVQLNSGPLFDAGSILFCD
jgi:hypothetical protein